MRLTALVVVALVLAGCGTVLPSSPAGPPSGEARLVIVDGEPGDAGISVTEALGHGPTDDIVAVTGALFVDGDGTVRLCEAIAESFPPQCGGASLVVDGLDLATVQLQQANGVRWADSVTLLGSVEAPVR